MSRGWFRRWSTWSLRTRLLVTTTVLMALLGGVIALSTTVFLEAYLNGQTDSQLSTMVDNATGAGGAGGLGGGGGQLPGPGMNGAPQPNQASFVYHDAEQTIGAVFVNGTLQDTAYNNGFTPGSRNSAGNLSGTATPFTVTAALKAALAAVPADGRVHTVTLPDGLGDYRVRNQPTMHYGNAGGSTSTLVGLPVGSTEGIVNKLIAIEAVITVSGLLGAAFVSAAVIRLSLRPLDRVAATAARISRLSLHRGEVGELVRVPDADTDPRTEAGQVGESVNRMIDHVSGALAARHASETRVRQFVADASHELRTPLASIAGYAELTRRGGEPVPPDTAYALSRIESEAGRMTRLVEDLLLLARLDAGRPLEREPVDLSPLVVDAVRDAHAATPDHRWQIRLPDDPVVVDGDPNRLHQVLVNLLANAGKHTPPGTTVTTSVTSGGGVCELTIEDDGPGIPPELLSTVFERFARGDHSRSRAAGSTGLGLAIVSAVVASHRGEVGVASRPGSTVFTVRLPVAAVALTG